MDGRNIEPRTVLWAVAEVSWEDPSGTPYRAPATLEDTSASGACIRLKSPITIGSRLVMKWKREQFSAIARNCRSDGKDFLLGVRRDTEHTQINPSPKKTGKRQRRPNSPVVRQKTFRRRQRKPKAPRLSRKPVRRNPPHQISCPQLLRPQLPVFWRRSRMRRAA
jgi:hypothetical protein